MVIFKETAAGETRGRRPTHMDGQRRFGDFSNDESTSNEGFLDSRTANDVYSGDSGGGAELRSYSEPLGSFGSRNYSNVIVHASRGYLGAHDSDSISDHGTTDGHNHSGLEGYGRFTGTNEETNEYLDVMDTSSDYRGNSSSSGNPVDTEPLCSIDSGLENYGRYLGSHPEPTDHNRSNNVEGFREYEDPSRSRSFEFSNGSLSDYQGLGSYSQPLQETGDFTFSRGLNGGLSHSSGHGDSRLF